MEAVAILIRTIVILTLSTGPVFVDLDKSMAPAGALQIAQDVAKQDFEAIGAKVYYCDTPLSLPSDPEKFQLRPRQEKEQVKPLTIAKVSKDWGDWGRTIPIERYAPKVMVITTSHFETQGQLAQAIEEAMPKARRVKRSTKDIMFPLPLDEKAYAVELRPEEAARFQIAEILVEEGKYTEAVNELEEIMKSTANEEVKNLVRARISTIYAKMGLDEKSEGELKKIVETTSNLELKKRALMTLAGVYRTQKRYDEAVAILRQVIELTQPDVMKLLQFRKEFMPPGFTFAAVRPDWPIRENPAWLTPEALNEVAESYDLRILPKRGYVCFFDKNGKATDDLLYALLEFGDEKTAAAAAAGISAEFREDQPEGYFGAAFAASNVVVMVSAEKADYIPAARWLVTTLRKALPAHLQAEATKVRPLPVRISVNEAAAVGALRSLMAGQEEFRMADIIDQDNDGAGEYGYFQELCATIAPAGHSKPISPKFLDPVFGVVNAQGCASKTGYYFRIFLPGPDGGPAVAEVSGANSTTASPGAMNSRENRWTAYAWPMDYDSTGSRAFVVNQAGNVFATAAMVTTYDGTAVMPGANAAFVVGTKNLSGALADGVGIDGNTWHPVDGRPRRKLRRR